MTIQEGIAAGRINQEWVEKRKQQWGEQSAVFQNRVLGEFADSGENSVIPLRWVELANERWVERNGIGEGATSYGVDPARFGEDKTTMAKLVGQVLEYIEAWAKEDTMQSAGRVAAKLGAEEPCAIDTIGVGAGVYDRLHELGYSVIPVNVSEKTALTDVTGQMSFVNLRSALWWMMRDSIDPEKDDLIALPPDDQLTGDLTAPQYKYTSNGKLVVESKDDIRARIGRSTDYADAYALAKLAASHGNNKMWFF